MSSLRYFSKVIYILDKTIQDKKENKLQSDEYDDIKRKRTGQKNVRCE